MRYPITTLNENFEVVRSGSLSREAVDRCRWHLVDLDHYRADDSCRCDELAERTRLQREFGYPKSAFYSIPLRDDA